MDSGVTKGWSLHPQLAQDTVPVGDLPLARVLLTNDANLPVADPGAAAARPGRAHRSRGERAGAIARRDRRGARALKNITGCDKLNIAALGNVVPQLHVHVIARRHSDAAWPKPVWGVEAAHRPTATISRQACSAHCVSRSSPAASPTWTNNLGSTKNSWPAIHHAPHHLPASHRRPAADNTGDPQPLPRVAEMPKWMSFSPTPRGPVPGKSGHR